MTEKSSLNTEINGMWQNAVYFLPANRTTIIGAIQKSTSVISDNCTIIL